jgi:hypothetical protein
VVKSRQPNRVRRRFGMPAADDLFDLPIIIERMNRGQFGEMHQRIASSLILEDVGDPAQTVRRIDTRGPRGQRSPTSRLSA